MFDVASRKEVDTEKISITNATEMFYDDILRNIFHLNS